MKYCKKTTQAHHISIAHPDCICAIRDIIKKEGGCELVATFNNDKVINLDNIEKCLAKRERRKQRPTMDITFGVSDCSKNCQMVLVDFKYRHKSFRGISSIDLTGKVQKSIEILGCMPRISSPYLFVVQSDLVQQARNHIARLFQNSPSKRQKYLAIDNSYLASFWAN